MLPPRAKIHIMNEVKIESNSFGCRSHPKIGSFERTNQRPVFDGTKARSCITKDNGVQLLKSNGNAAGTATVRLLLPLLCRSCCCSCYCSGY